VESGDTDESLTDELFDVRTHRLLQSLFFIVNTRDTCRQQTMQITSNVTVYANRTKCLSWHEGQQQSKFTTETYRELLTVTVILCDK
jgi:hypothetical protein